MMAPTLVTGATGLVGNNVVRQLLKQGRPVRVLVRHGADPHPLDGLPVETICGDVRDPQSVSQAIRGASQVIHAAGYVHVGRTQLALHRAIHVEGSRNVARAARAAKIRMVHVSSCDAIGVRSLAEPADEDTPLAPPVPCSYVISKREAEQAVLEEHALGLDVVIANPGFMLGPWDWKPSSGRMLLEVAKGRGVFAPYGHFSLCDVRDVAAGILAALEKGQGGRRYILAGQTISYLEAWQLFAQVAGVRPPLSSARPHMLMLRAIGRACDLWAALTGCEPDVNSAAIALARLPKSYSSERARRELNYTTRPAIQSVQDAWQWFREHGYIPNEQHSECDRRMERRHAA
jgi:dihydroflavonol-4-reductase